AVGAPKEVTMNLPGFDVKVPPNHNGSRTRPYIRVALQFDGLVVRNGKAEMVKAGADQGKVRITYLIPKGTRLADGAFKYRWDGGPKIGTAGAEKDIADLKRVQPRLNSDLKLLLYLKASAQGLVFDRVDAPAPKFDLGLPGLPKPFAGLQPQFKDVSGALTKQIQSEFKKVGAALKLADKFASYGKKSLLKTVQAGNTKITALNSLSIQGGKLVALVSLPPAYKGPPYAAELKKVIAKLKSPEVKAKFAKVKKVSVKSAKR